jgi:hypothetical protein
MKRLSRLGVMTATVEDFLKALKRDNTETFKTIEPTLIDRYLDNGVKGFNYFGHVKPSERDRAMLTVANDIFTLITNFQSDPLVSVRTEFGLLERVFNDQCRVSQEEKIQAGSEIVLRSDSEAESSVMINVDDLTSGDNVTKDDDISVQINIPKVELIPSKDISSGSLQNPSDPDAAFSSHKGQGYHAQLFETYNPTDDLGESDERPLNLITLVKVEIANEPDSAALIPVLDELEKNGLKPDVLTADTAYGGDANFVHAASKGVELLSPVSGNGSGRSEGKGLIKLTSAEEQILSAQMESFASEIAVWPEVLEDEDVERPQSVRLSDFTSDENGVIKSCPNGQTAETQRYSNNKGGRAYFDRKVCMSCPLCGLCPVTITKNKAWLAYHDEQVRLDKRRTYQETNEFKDRYRWRSGIEGLFRIRNKPSYAEHKLIPIFS